MKYMGSKRWMLSNGLGEVLDSASPKAARFVDLFSGSAAVSAFVATRHKVKVISCDLQVYSSVLSGAIVERTESLVAERMWADWKQRAQKTIRQIGSIPDTSRITRSTVLAAREWCASRRHWSVTRAYGGHYFSPHQALWLDALRETLPRGTRRKTVALSALIQAASYCAAAPGHTAQPFQPTATAKSFIRDAWNRDVPQRVEKVLSTICRQHARVIGRAIVADAGKFAATLRDGDLAFIDPPYSAVQYSRFYHVLETIATGAFETVTGVGRYPSANVRPKSKFSYVSESTAAFHALLKDASTRGADAIITFPEHECSNGLSGRLVEEIASKYFSVRRRVVSSRFSSLGGTSGTSESGSDRAARVAARELILHLRSR